jgi:HEAT repeat protein
MFGLERPREERVKLLLAPAFGPLQRVLSALRALPWPAPLQRVTARSLERLKARIPELAELLDGPQPKRPRAQADSRAPVNALPELLELLKARDYASRTQAAQALANHREPEATEALIHALRDRSVEVAVAAATALSVAGGERATQALLAVLDNTEGYYHALVRAGAVHGLGSLLPRDERTALVRALRDLEAEVSIAAIAAFSNGGREAAPALLAVVENTDGFYLPITRLAAARGLERLPPYGTGELERVRAWESDPIVREILERLISRNQLLNTH